MSLESIKKQVKEEIEKLSRVLHLLESGAKRKQTKLAKTWGGMRRLSAAGRRRIAEAQKARWARVRAADKKAA